MGCQIWHYFAYAYILISIGPKAISVGRQFWVLKLRLVRTQMYCPSSALFLSL